MRIFVEILHVRVSGCAVEVEVVFLDVLAVVAFAIGEAEKPFFKDGIVAVPERQCEAQHSVTVGNSRQTVLSP